MTNYRFVNPHIEGEFKNLFTGKTPTNAADNAWNSLSEYIKGDIPKFAFTLERVSDKKLFSFIVKEKKVGNKNVDYSLKIIEKNPPKSTIKKFKSKLALVKKQYGGNKSSSKRNNNNDDDDEDDDDSSYIYKRMKHLLNREPIVYWWYSPWYYDIEYFYMPNFLLPYTPYVQIDLSSAYFP